MPYAIMERGSPWVTLSLICNKWPEPSPVSHTTSVGGVPREMAAAPRRGVREVGRKYNQEREATGSSPLSESTGTFKNTKQ